MSDDPSPVAAPPRAHTLIRFALTSAGVNFWLALLGLVTTPFLIERLGAAAYAVFAMVSVVSSHLSNLELGFGHATVRSLARARSAGRHDDARAAISTALAVFLMGGVIAGGGLALAATPLVKSVFNVPSDLTTAALTAFRVGGFILTCSFLSSFFASALQALARFDWLNGSRVLFGTAAAGAAVAVVASGGGVAQVFLAQAVIAGVSCLVLCFAVARAHGEWPWPRLHRRALAEMWRFGAAVFAAGVAYQWMVNGPPLVLAAIVEAAEIPAFSVPHTVFQKLLLLIGSASFVFFPFASAASATEDHAGLASMFRSHLRLSMLVMGVLVAYLAAFGETLLSAWVNPNFGRSAAPCLTWLAWSGLMVALSAPAADVCRGLGRPSWTLAYTAGVALLALALSLMLIPTYRAPGAALAFFLALAGVTGPFVFVVAWRLLGVSPADLCRVVAGPTTACLGVWAIWTLLARHAGLLWAVAAGAVVTLAYAAVVDRFVLAPHERHALRRSLRQ